MNQSVNIYLVLLHYPMTNRNGERVTTSVTNMDIHDISRTCRTYGIKNYYIVTPLVDQHTIVGRLLDHWKTEKSREFHPDRVEALSRVKLLSSFDEVMEDIAAQNGGDKAEVVLTDARPQLEKQMSYSEYREVLKSPTRTRPSVIVFGTGWGVHPSFHSRVDVILDPVLGSEGAGGYNHLSVRAAVAIILDRLSF
ncbi:MAG: RNA methyltransferase [Xanthomonadaceae bacterium]|nr:RNA methyltransferase [Xanthomonadaceae bacterium]